MRTRISTASGVCRRRGTGAIAGTLLATGLTVLTVNTGAQDTASKAGGDGKETATQLHVVPILRTDTQGKDTKRKDTKSKNTKSRAGKTKQAPKAQQPNRSVRSVGTRPAPGPPNSGGPPITILPVANTTAPPAGTRFSFTFNGSDITNVLKFYAQMANTSVLMDSSVSGPVTIINNKQVTLDEAFEILQSVLAVRGFTAIQQKNAVIITPFANAAKNTPLLNSGLSDRGPTRVDPRNQVMTQVIPLENVDAEALARELQPLINTGASLIGSSGTNALILTDTASNVQRFIDLAEALDKTSNKTELKTYVLRRAEAGAVADIINNLFKQTSARGRGGAAPQPGQPGFNPNQPQQPGGAGIPAVVAVADPRTNSVLVVASPDAQQKVATDIISRLDDDETNTMEPKIRKINYADAQQVANTVNGVLSNLHNGGGNASSSGPSFQSRVYGYGGGGNEQQTVNSTDPFGKVVAEPRTNSVIITASPDRMKIIDGLVDELDQNVVAEPTTFVFPLKNAQADDVAYALSQAFGTTNSGNGDGNFYNINSFGGNGLNNNKHQPIQRRQRPSSPLSGRGVMNRGVPPGPPDAPDDTATGGAGSGGNSSNGNSPNGNSPTDNGGSALPQGVSGVMTPNGFVPTETGADANGNGKPTRQFYFGRYGYGGNQQNQSQYGRGRLGNYTNLLQLRNNVYVTPSPTGDSIIVTTTPDNYEAIAQIVAALDVVPRQVMMDVIVAEVDLDADQKLGFALSSTFKNLLGDQNSATGVLNVPGPGFNPSTGDTVFNALNNGAQFTLTNGNYNLLLEALETNTKVKVLATPHIFTANSQQAEIDITTKIPYESGTTVSGFSSLATTSVTFADVGYILNVTPLITRGGQVTIDVIAEAGNLLGFQTVGSGANAQQVPEISDRYVDTEVTAQDGQTVVLGGLISDTQTLTVTKVPILSDIPILGQLFRGRDKSHTRTELVVFMTPHVINSVEEAREMALKKGASVIHQIPDLSRQEPNLKLPDTKQATPRSGKGTRFLPKNQQPTSPPPGGTGTTPNNNGGNPNINGGNP